MAVTTQGQSMSFPGPAVAGPMAVPPVAYTTPPQVQLQTAAVPASPTGLAFARDGSMGRFSREPTFTAPGVGPFLAAPGIDAGAAGYVMVGEQQPAAMAPMPTAEVGQAYMNMPVGIDNSVGPNVIEYVYPDGTPVDPRDLQGQPAGPVMYEQALDQYVMSPEQPMVTSQFGTYYPADSVPRDSRESTFGMFSESTFGQQSFGQLVQPELRPAPTPELDAVTFGGQQRVVGARPVTREEMLAQGVLHTVGPAAGEATNPYLVQQEFMGPMQQVMTAEPFPVQQQEQYVQYVDEFGQPVQDFMGPGQPQAQTFLDFGVPARQPPGGLPQQQFPSRQPLGVVQEGVAEQQYGAMSTSQIDMQQFAVPPNSEGFPQPIPAVGAPPSLGAPAPLSEEGQVPSSACIGRASFGRGSSGGCAVPDSGIGLDNRFLKKWWPWNKEGGAGQYQMTDMVQDFDPQAPPTGSFQEAQRQGRLVQVVG